MSLQDKIPAIIQHIDNHMDFMQFNLRLYEMLEGQIQKEVEASLRREILSQAAFRRIRERIPPINILRKTTDKLSKVYVEHAKRLTDNNKDQEIMNNIEKESGLDEVMMQANRFYNAQNGFAIEPYLYKGQHKFRVLAGHQFIPYSDDPSNPNRMTVAIKFLGTKVIPRSQEFNDSGRKVTNDDDVREVDIYALYSDDEFMIINTGGGVDTAEMMKRGITSTKNPFGRIPFVYKNKSSIQQLIPFPNKEGFDMSILIPKLLADLNYSAQFQSHSILWSKNTELEGKEINPDTVLDLGDKTEDGGEPEIGVIKPEVDIEQVLNLTNYQLVSYFESLGIMLKSSQVLANGRDTSAIGKAVDEADTTAVHKEQMKIFRGVEEELWGLVADMQSVWASSSLEENRVFSKEFIDKLRVIYPEPRVIKTFSQKITEVRELRAEKLMTRKQSLQHMFPEMTEEKIENWIKELDDEQEEFMDKMMTMGINPGPERKPDGTFQDGNMAAAEQDETSKDESGVDEQSE